MYIHPLSSTRNYVITYKLTGKPFDIQGLRKIFEETELPKSLSLSYSGEVPKEYVFEILLWGTPSYVTVLSEYAIAESLRCPHCNSSLTFKKQEIMKDLQGDVLTLKCSSCGKDVKMIFKFRKADSVLGIEDWGLLALAELLTRSGSGNIPNYVYFNKLLKSLINEVKDSWKYSEFLNYVNLLFRTLYYIRLVRPRARNTPQQFNQVLFNSLKLLVSVGDILNTKLPEIQKVNDILEEGIASVGTQYVSTWRKPSRLHTSFPTHDVYGEPGVVLTIDGNVLKDRELVKEFIGKVSELSRMYDLRNCFVILISRDGISVEEVTSWALDEELKLEYEVMEGPILLSPAIEKALGHFGLDKVLVVLTKGYILDVEETYDVAERVLYNFSKCLLITTSSTPLLPKGWRIGKLLK